MKLLVVTPTRGESPWLAETVAAVRALPVPYVHVLVAPPGAVARLAARFPDVTVWPEPGGGMFAAINVGLTAVERWDAFTYINDDDLLLPRVGAVAAAVAEQPHAPLIAYGGVRLIAADGRRLGSIPISPRPALNRALYSQRIEPVYQHGTVIARAVVDKVGAFDASFRFCGDSEFLARACLAGVPFSCITTRAVAAFRLRPGQLTKNRPEMTAERARVDLKLSLCPAALTPAHRVARWRFRIANAFVYAERVARHGFITFDQLLERAN